jgi:hypothetical protein
MIGLWLVLGKLILLSAPVLFVLVLMNTGPRFEMGLFLVALPIFLFLMGAHLVFTALVAFNVPILLLGAISMGLSAFWLSAVIPGIIDSYREPRT